MTERKDRTHDKETTNIINGMNTKLFSVDNNVIKNIYQTDCKLKPHEIDYILDHLLVLVSERTMYENKYPHRIKEDDEKLAFVNGEIRGILFGLGITINL